jgi:Rrf2 family protein
MFTLNRKTDYALIALTGLADRQTEAVSTRDLAGQLQLPLPALRNILKDLARQGLVTATQGPRGGYRLAREPGRITVAEVVEAIEGPMKFARCCSLPGEAEEAHECRLERSCRIKGAIRRMHGRVVDLLGRTTLEELAGDGVEAAVGEPTTVRLRLERPVTIRNGAI